MVKDEGGGMWGLLNVRGEGFESRNAGLRVRGERCGKWYEG